MHLFPDAARDIVMIYEYFFLTIYAPSPFNFRHDVTYMCSNSGPSFYIRFI